MCYRLLTVVRHSDCRAGNQDARDTASCICLAFRTSGRWVIRWKEIQDAHRKRRKVKFEVTNTEVQILFLAFIHCIPFSDLSPLTILFFVYIYTHRYTNLHITYMYTHLQNSCISFLPLLKQPVLLMWEEHETDKMTNDVMWQEDYSAGTFSSRKAEISEGRRAS